MNRIKITGISLLVFLVISFLTSTASANNSLNYLVTNPPKNLNTGGVTIYGANPPGSGASVHDLTKSVYNYQVQEVGYQVFTDKWLKGATTFKVSVKNWKVLENYGGTSNQLSIAVLNSSGGVISSKTIIFPQGTTSASISLSGLVSSTKYYVRFRVPTNGNKYSFNGTISK